MRPEAWIDGVADDLPASERLACDRMLAAARTHLVPAAAPTPTLDSLRADGGRLWLARPGGPVLVGAPRVLGLIDLRLHHPGPGEATVAVVVVDAAARFRGVGRSLVDHGLAVARDEGVEMVYAFVRTTAAADFWSAVGFEAQTGGRYRRVP
jgi:ribosomal protein S18 acetylase RimI-like enzyme